MAKEKWLKSQILNAADRKRGVDQAMKKVQDFVRFVRHYETSKKDGSMPTAPAADIVAPSQGLPQQSSSSALALATSLHNATNPGHSRARHFSDLQRRFPRHVSLAERHRFHLPVLSRRRPPRTHSIEGFSRIHKPWSPSGNRARRPLSPVNHQITSATRSCPLAVHLSNRSGTIITGCSSRLRKNGSDCVNGSEDLRLRQCLHAHSIQRRCRRLDRFLGPGSGAWSRRPPPRRASGRAKRIKRACGKAFETVERTKALTMRNCDC